MIFGSALTGGENHDRAKNTDNGPCGRPCLRHSHLLGASARSEPQLAASKSEPQLAASKSEPQLAASKSGSRRATLCASARAGDRKGSKNPRVRTGGGEKGGRHRGRRNKNPRHDLQRVNSGAIDGGP